MHKQHMSFKDYVQSLETITTSHIFDALLSANKDYTEKEVKEMVLNYLSSKDKNGNLNKIEVNKLFHPSLKKSKILQDLLKKGLVKIHRPAYSRAQRCGTVNMYPAGTSSAKLILY